MQRRCFRVSLIKTELASCSSMLFDNFPDGSPNEEWMHHRNLSSNSAHLGYLRHLACPFCRMMCVGVKMKLKIYFYLLQQSSKSPHFHHIMLSKFAISFFSILVNSQVSILIYGKIRSKVMRCIPNSNMHGYLVARSINNPITSKRATARARVRCLESWWTCMSMSMLPRIHLCITVHKYAQKYYM